jgi:hypothetical protein
LLHGPQIIGNTRSRPDSKATDKKETTMKLLSVAALLAPLALTLPLSAHAAMDAKTKTSYMNECTTAATQSNPSMDAAAVKAHCECGAQQINKNFSDKEIASLNDKTTPPSADMTSRLQAAVSKNCLSGEK